MSKQQLDLHAGKAKDFIDDDLCDQFAAGDISLQEALKLDDTAIDGLRRQAIALADSG